MDRAAVRMVAIDVGHGEPGRARAVVARAVAIAAVVSSVVALPTFVGAGRIVAWLAARREPGALRAAAAAALPFVAALPGIPLVADLTAAERGALMLVLGRRI